MLKNIVKNLTPSSTLKINEISRELENKGKKIFKFGFGQSPFQIPLDVVNELKNNAHQNKYLPMQGLKELREIVAKYTSLKKNVHLVSMSGGTDIVSCFVGGNPNQSVYAGEIQSKALGMDVDIYNEDGTSIKQIKGELVCKSTFPSKPIYFWGDNKKREKFFKAYFSKYKNIWHHGDYAEIKKNTGGFIIYGRSDTTLNPGGVRLGTSEIYSEVEKFQEINESIVVGQSWDNDIRIILFVVLNKKYPLDKNLIIKIRKKIKENASPRHVPAKIISVTDIPRTKNGKIVELAVKNVIEGNEIKNKEALSNPEVLEQYQNLKE